MSTKITRKQGIKMLQKLFQLDSNIQKLCTYYSQHEKIQKEQIVQFIKAKFKQIILEIQCQLFRSNKIKQLKMFDYSSELMFDVLLSKLGDYFPKRLGFDFVFQEKCKYMKVEKSSTSKKMELYSIFLDYATQHNLYQYVLVENQSKIKTKGHVQNAEKLYQSHQLQLICLYYEIYEGDQTSMQNMFKQRGFNSQKFQGSNLKKNIQNLLLIGLYKCYIKSMKSRNGKGLDWEKFMQDQSQHLQMVEQWDYNLKLILLKAAIRNEIKTQQIRFICRKMNRRFEDKPFIDILQQPPQTKDERFCDSQEMNKLRQQLLAVLKTKIWFNNVSQGL